MELEYGILTSTFFFAFSVVLHLMLLLLIYLQLYIPTTRQTVFTVPPPSLPWLRYLKLLCSCTQRPVTSDNPYRTICAAWPAYLWWVHPMFTSSKFLLMVSCILDYTVRPRSSLHQPLLVSCIDTPVCKYKI
jgi:hypothetical protein